VLDALEAADAPPTSAQLAVATGLAPSVIRHHLRRLRDAGAIAEVAHGAASGRRGRPARTWRLRPAVDVFAIASVATELAQAQGASIDDPATAAAIIELGRQLAATGDGDSIHAVRGGLARLGFAPSAVQGEEGHEQIVLAECPFIDPSRGVTDLAICRVHGLLAQGMAEPARRVEQVDVEPSGRGCVIRLGRAQRRPQVELPIVVIRSEAAAHDPA